MYGQTFNTLPSKKDLDGRSYCVRGRLYHLNNSI